MHLLDPRSGVLPVALCVFLAGTILYSWWVQASRANSSPEKRDDVNEPPQSKSA